MNKIIFSVLMIHLTRCFKNFSFIKYISAEVKLKMRAQRRRSSRQDLKFKLWKASRNFTLKQTGTHSRCDVTGPFLPRAVISGLVNSYYKDEECFQRLQCLTCSAFPINRFIVGEPNGLQYKTIHTLHNQLISKKHISSMTLRILKLFIKLLINAT